MTGRYVYFVIRFTIVNCQIYILKKTDLTEIYILKKNRFNRKKTDLGGKHQQWEPCLQFTHVRHLPAGPGCQTCERIVLLFAFIA